LSSNIQAGMASAAVNSRLRYLDAVATRFSITAPTVVAGLRIQSVRLADDSGVLLSAAREDVCGACGSVLVPGSSCTKTIQLQVDKSRKSASKVKSITKETSNTKPKKVMVYTCKRCNKNTRIPIGQPPQRKQTTVLKVEEKPEINAPIPALSSLQATDDIAKPALAYDVAVVANQSQQVLTKSRQRAKTKKQSGLQALLAKNKANASAAASPAFDLMDFMKTS